MRKSFLLLLPLLLVTSCNAARKIIGDVTIRDVKYDPETRQVSWRAVKSGMAEVSSFSVSVNGGEAQTVYGNGTIGTLAYDSHGEDFTIHIVANTNVSGTKDYESEFHNLGQVSNLYVANGAVNWDSVPGVSAYQVKNGNAIVAESTSATSLNIEPGNFAVTVRPYGGPGDANGNLSWYSYWSEVERGTLLRTPTNLTYDSTTIKWDAVSMASGYELTINDQVYETALNSYSFTGANYDISLAVKAVGDIGSKVYDSAFCTTEEYKYLRPVELRCEDGIVLWDGVAGADRYAYKINNITQSTYLSEPKFSGIQAGVSTTISVLPDRSDGHSFSEWSIPLTVKILPAPVAKYENNIIKWDSIPGAGGYDVKIVTPIGEESIATVGDNTFSFDYSFSAVGAYKVFVKANANPNIDNNFSSKYSEPVNITRLPAPGEIRLQSMSDASEQIRISVAPVIGATKYELFANGVSKGQSSNGQWQLDASSILDLTEENIISFEVKAIGGTNRNPIYLDSLTGAKIDATQLGTPQNVTVSGAKLRWDTVSKAQDYIVTIDSNYRNKTNGANEYDLSTLTAGTHNIYVQACGLDGDTTIIPSHSSTLKTVTKLTKPIPFIDAYAEGTKYRVSWQSITGTTGYKVKVGDTEYTAASASFDLTGQEDYFPTGRGTALSVRALGDGENYLDSDYSDTLTFVRYQIPYGLKLDNGSIVWQADSVESIRPSSFIVEINGEEQVVNGTSLSLAKFEAGDYSVRVKCHGSYSASGGSNRNITIDSDWTSKITFTKLASVENVVREGKRISWDPVVGETKGYRIEFNTTASPITADIPHGITYYDLKDNEFTAEATKNFYIYTLGDNDTTVTSSPNVVAQEIRALPTPQFTTNEELAEGQFTVVQEGNRLTITMAPNANATAYKLLVDGKATTNSASEPDANVFVYTMEMEDTQYKIQVQYAGEIFGADGVYYITSNPSVAKPFYW